MKLITTLHSLAQPSVWPKQITEHVGSRTTLFLKSLVVFYFPFSHTMSDITEPAFPMSAAWAVIKQRTQIIPAIGGRCICGTAETGTRKPDRMKTKKLNFEKAVLSPFPFLLFFVKGILMQWLTFQKSILIDDMTDSAAVIGGIWFYSAFKNNA